MFGFRFFQRHAGTLWIITLVVWAVYLVGWAVGLWEAPGPWDEVLD